MVDNALVVEACAGLHSTVACDSCRVRHPATIPKHDQASSPRLILKIKKQGIHYSRGCYRLIMTRLYREMCPAYDALEGILWVQDMEINGCEKYEYEGDVSSFENKSCFVSNCEPYRWCVFESASTGLVSS
jgi:hypothetical protein